MRITRLASYVLASAVLLVGASSPAMAQQAGATQEKADDKATVQTISGTLTQVDAEKMLLTVQMADGAEWSFGYTSQTQVVSGDTEQGLATIEGSKVIVHYTKTDDKKTATKVEVQPPATKE